MTINQRITAYFATGHYEMAALEISRQYGQIVSPVAQLELNECITPDLEYDSYEDVIRKALILDSVNNLAHTYGVKKNGILTFPGGSADKTKYFQLMTLKNSLMTEFALECIKNNLNCGLEYEVDKGYSFVVDIPYIGNVGWHFGEGAGGLSNTKHTPILDNFRKDIQARGYQVHNFPGKVEDKILPNGASYSNADLLLQEVPMVPGIPKSDYNLLKYGTREEPKAPKSQASYGE